MLLALLSFILGSLHSMVISEISCESKVPFQFLANIVTIVIVITNTSLQKMVYISSTKRHYKEALANYFFFKFNLTIDDDTADSSLSRFDANLSVRPRRARWKRTKVSGEH